MSQIKPHNLFFLFGFIYYLVVPLFIGYLGLMVDMPAMDRWHTEFINAKKNLDSYIVIIASYFIAFYLGSNFIKLLPAKRMNFKTVTKFPIKNLNIVGYLFFFVALSVAVSYKDILFTGYKTYELSILGALATLNNVSLIFYFYILFNTGISSKNIFLWNIIFSSILLIGLGSRMYVLIPLIALFTYKLFFSKKKWKFNKVIFYGFLILVFILIIGAWRIGSNISVDFLIYLFLAEPTFTWWSTATFLGNNELSMIGIPANYFSSFLNFLPSFIFKNKSNMIIGLNEYYYYIGPLGADSIFVSIQGNFGWYFGTLFMFCVGFYYSLIEFASRKNSFLMAYYIGVVSILPFQFFRDNFAIINKQIFWNILIVPFVILTVLLFLLKVSKFNTKKETT